MPGRALERLIFASRWLLAPFYVGLVGALAMLLVKFAQELVEVLPHLLGLKGTDVLLAVLTLLDLTLAANLVLMVILSGYESFVARIESAGGDDRLAWMGKLDFAGIKLKLVSSIVAIAAVDLLKAFMDVAATDKTDLMWLVVILAAFVVAGVLLALTDYLTALAKARGGG